MSCLTDHGSVNKKTPVQGVREDQKKSPIDAVAHGVSDGSEDGEVKDDLPIRTKRSPSASIEEEPVPKKLKPAPEPMANLFTEMRRLQETTPCVISVDGNEPIGGLYPVRQGFAINLYVNPGPEYAPSISLIFKTTGTGKGVDSARIEWDTEAVVKRQFAMSDFEYGYASPDAPDPRRRDPKVLGLCNNKHMSQLLYIRFKSWNQATGFSHKNAFKNQSPVAKKAIETICQPSESYHMEIWFLAPFNAETFRRGCLRYFIDSLKSRQNPLQKWEDPLGTRYVDSQVPPRSTRRADRRMGKIMFRVGGFPQARDAETAQSVDDAAHMLAQAELLQLRQDSAAKDEEISRLRALLINCQASLTAIKQGFTALNKSYHETTEDLSSVVQDIDNVLEAKIAFNELPFMPRSPVADTAAGPSQPSSSASKPEKNTADTAAGPPQSSSSASKPEETTANTAAGLPQPSRSASKSEKTTAPQPSRSASKQENVATISGSASTTSSTLDYAQALKSPAERLPRLPRAKVPLEQSPLFARPPVTHADLATKREAASQAHSEPERQQTSQKPNRASTRGRSAQRKDTRGRGDTRGQGNPRPEKGETLYEFTTKGQSPLTSIEHSGSKPTQVTVPGSLEERVVSQGTNTTAGSNQPPNDPEVKSSVANPATQTGRDSLADKDKEASSNPDPTPATRRPKKVSEEQRLANLIKYLAIISDKDSEDEQIAESQAVATPVPATPGSSPPKDVKNEPQLLNSTTDSHSGIDLSGTATADVKPTQSLQIEPAIPLKMMSVDRPSDKRGEDEPAIKESEPQGSKLPHAKLDLKSDTESITASVVEKTGPSHGPSTSPVTREVD